MRPGVLLLRAGWGWRAGPRVRGCGLGQQGLGLAAGFQPRASAVARVEPARALLGGDRGDFPLPPSPRGVRARGRKAGARDRAPGVGFRVCFYLALRGAAQPCVPSSPAGPPPRARPRRDGRDRRTQRRGGSESDSPPSAARPRTGRDRQSPRTQGSPPSSRGRRRARLRRLPRGGAQDPAPSVLLRGPQPRRPLSGASSRGRWARSPKYTSLLHLGHLGMAAPGPVQAAAAGAHGLQARDWVGPVRSAPFRDPGTPPLGDPAPRAPPPEPRTWTLGTSNLGPGPEKDHLVHPRLQAGPRPD